MKNHRPEAEILEILSGYNPLTMKLEAYLKVKGLAKSTWFQWMNRYKPQATGRRVYAEIVTKQGHTITFYEPISAELLSQILKQAE
jgi:hypothetical protein